MSELEDPCEMALPSVEVRRCGSYRPGHEVHWIQAKVSMRGAHRAATATVDQLGWIAVNLDDGDSIRLWTHHPERLRALLLGSRGRVELRPESVLAVPKADGAYLVGVGTEPYPCPPADESPERLPLDEVLRHRGGFAVRLDATEKSD